MAKEQAKVQSKDVEFKPLELIGDEPVLTLHEDRLSLRNFAETVAAVSLGTEGPFTIGVFGGWGHGKTSLLRLSRDMVDAQGREDVTTVWFNAWQFEKESHPIVPLVATIIRAIEHDLARHATAKIKKGGGRGSCRLRLGPGVRSVNIGFRVASGTP